MFFQSLFVVGNWLSFLSFLQFLSIVLGIAAGTLTIVEMGNRGYSKQQTVLVMLAIALLGLGLGSIIILI
jgi:hypothetical protein